MRNIDRGNEILMFYFTVVLIGFGMRTLCIGCGGVMEVNCGQYQPPHCTMCTLWLISMLKENYNFMGIYVPEMSKHFGIVLVLSFGYRF